MKRFFFKILLSGFTLLVLAGITGIAEIALRQQERAQIQAMENADTPGGVTKSDVPGLNYTLTAGYRKGGIVINRLGFNMPEKPIEKAPGTVRVLFVGDSVTQGVGITNTSEAFPNRVDELLPEPFDVWNCGVGGYNARQVLLLMRHVLPSLQPDAIIYAFNFNDYWDANRFFFGQAAPLPEQQSMPEQAGWLDRLKKLRVVLRLRDAYAEIAYRIRGFSPVYVDRKTGYPSWRQMKDVISLMKSDSEKAGLPFAVVVLPNEQFLHVDPSRNRAHTDIASFLARENIEYFDLLPALLAHRDEEIYLKDGNHMTPYGYDLAAREIAAWMTRRQSFFITP